MAAFDSMVIYPGWGKNEADINTNELESEKYSTDALVIGSGMAGLFATVKAHDAGAKTIMAYNIGAKVTGKEWKDVNPGQSTNAAACFDGWHGMFERSPGTTGVEICYDLRVDLNYLACMSGNSVKMGRPGNGGSDNISRGPYVPDEFKRRKGPPEIVGIFDIILFVDKISRFIDFIFFWVKHFFTLC